MSNLKRKLNAPTLSDKLKIINEIDKGVQKKNQIARILGFLENFVENLLK